MSSIREQLSEAGQRRLEQLLKAEQRLREQFRETEQRYREQFREAEQRYREQLHEVEQRRREQMIQIREELRNNEGRLRGTIEAIEFSPYARVPLAKVNQQHVDNGTKCTTCLESFNLDEEVAKLDCGHIFHRQCIIPWLERNNTCPICREKVDPAKW